MFKKKQIANQFKKYQDKVNAFLEEYAENKESWKYLEVIITVFSVAFFIVFAIRPAVVTISGLVGEINEKKDLTQKMQRKINSVIIAQEEFALVQGNRYILESYLPSEFAISQGIAQVAGAANEIGLPVEQLSVDHIQNMTNPPKSFSGQKFNFSTKGDYQDIKEFIRLINLVRRWMEINNYQIGLNKDKEAALTSLTFFLNGQFHYWFENTYGQEINNK
jgi:hypothetical protein